MHTTRYPLFSHIMNNISNASAGFLKGEELSLRDQLLIPKMSHWSRPIHFLLVGLEVSLARDQDC